jgi:UDP-N-acetylmuramyl tripeptide synthase
MNLRNFFSGFLGKSVAQISRIRGGHGSALPGLVVEKIDPHFLKRVFREIPVAVISGTNGKTTTTKMAVELLEKNGLRVFTNDSGSNFSRGVASSAARKMKRGKLDFDVAILELDEAHAVKFVREIQPDFSLLLNVLRDQLDRFGEIDTTAKMLAEIAKNTSRNLVLNANDPRIARNSEVAEAEVSWFGFSRNLATIFPTDEQLHDDKSSRKNLKKDADNLAKFDTKNDEILLTDFAKNNVAEYEFRGEKIRENLAAGGAHNALNGAAALQLVRAILSDKNSRKSATKKFNFAKNVELISRVKPAFGRGEIIEIFGRKIVLNLVKNPAGFQSVLRGANADIPTLFAVNDQYADGRDVSWLYDVDFAKFRENKMIFTTGIRAFDIALRLEYDGVNVAQIEPEIREILKEFFAKNDGELQIFATYTAMLEIRKILKESAADFAKNHPKIDAKNGEKNE